METGRFPSQTDPLISALVIWILSTVRDTAANTQCQPLSTCMQICAHTYTNKYSQHTTYHTPHIQHNTHTIQDTERTAQHYTKHITRTTALSIAHTIEYTAHITQNTPRTGHNPTYHAQKTHHTCKAPHAHSFFNLHFCCLVLRQGSL